MYTRGHSRIVGTGVYLPEERVSSRQLLEQCDSYNRFGIRHNWLERTTGIKERRVTPAGVLPSDMAVLAAREAMERAALLPSEIDAIIYTGLTRDFTEPATAHIVQAKLGADNATVFDVSNACHGFMNGVHLMDSLIATGQVRRGLVVTGEQGSLFARRAMEALKNLHSREDFLSLAANFTVGDAGAAFVMAPKVDPECGFMGFMLQSQGRHANLCVAGGPLNDGPGFTDMPTLICEGLKLLTQPFREFMYERLQWSVNELKKYVFHQVGTKVLLAHSRLVGVPLAIMPRPVETFGNLITANIPFCIHNFVLRNEVLAGDKVYLSGIGSGISLSQTGLIWTAQ